MLKHVVMWRFKENAGGKTRKEHALWMKEHLESLSGVIPEIRSLEVGVNVSLSEVAYDAVLITVFDDVEAMQRYQKHPAHLEIADYCKQMRENRVVVDYEF